MNNISLSQPIFTLTTGPVDSYPAVLSALSKPVLYDYDPAFLKFYAEVTAKAQRAFRSKNRPVILQGEPVLGLEAAAASLIAEDDVVLNLASGPYGKGFADWARRYCRKVISLEVAFNDVLDPGAVEAALLANPDVTIVSLCHHDTPSGTINPAPAIGAVVKQHGALLMVDAVSSFGGMDITPDGCHADIFVTGPNKCLGCPPGLTLLGVSDDAWAKMKANPRAPRASILSILDWENAWDPTHKFPFTPSVAEINALDAGLDVYLDEGPEHVWARHAITAQACRAGIVAMGLSIWPAREAIASPTATAFKVPEGVDANDLMHQARLRYGVMFSAGRGATMGKIIRIGHMGPTAKPIYATIALTALAGALNVLGCRCDVGIAISAAMAVIDTDLDTAGISNTR